ncbi:MAG TPA: glycosyltransferase family 4 protein [Candidatus Nanoarchaeia archaeon]|nr:glycosyltransferase family 4 protein [Candidatus Nanoarchaeia archaeon]
MKTALVLTSTFPRWKNDTTPRFVYELSDRLAEMGTKIIVMAPHADGALKQENIEHVDIHRFRYFYPYKLQKLAYGAGIIPNFKRSFAAKLNVPFFLLSEYFSASRLIKQENPDIIHAHWLIPQGIIGAMLKNKKTKLIVTVHGSDLFPLKNFIFRFLQRNVLKKADFCTVNSEATWNELVKRFPEYQSKVKLIPMGVDTDLFVRKDVKSKFRQYKNKKIILYVGRLNEQKGIGYLIKSLPTVNKKISNSRLLIIGEGAYKKELQKLVDSLNLENVEFLGSIPHKNLVDYYNLADVFVLPAVTSRIGTEGQGLVLAEAMACGACVIGTETGGIKFLIKNNQNGLLVKEKDESHLADSIIQVLSDNKLKKKLSKNGIQFVKKNYSWGTIVRKFNNLYNS